MAINFEELAVGCGEWLKGSGPESDIVISSRIRLARNLADFPFISRATEADREEIEKILHARITASSESQKFPSELFYVDVGTIEEIDRMFLMERQLISRELSDGSGARAVAIDQGEQYSVMINEEDHLRIQVMHSGLDLGAVWEQVNKLDDVIEEQVTYA